MFDMKSGTAEERFADIIWQHEPITSGALSRLAEDEFGWKKTTSFTVLKRLCERGLFQNKKGTVTSLVSRDEFLARKSEKYVDESFGGSLPAFLAAFGSRKKIKAEEADELLRIIESMREKND